MLRSNNDLTERQTFSMRVQKRHDGLYEAICRNTDKVPPVVASTEAMAISKMDTLLQNLHADGKL